MKDDREIRQEGGTLHREIDSTEWNRQVIERFSKGIPKGAVKMTRAGAAYLYPQLLYTEASANEVVWVLKGEIVYVERGGKL